jgi:hypothetical protein
VRQPSGSEGQNIPVMILICDCLPNSGRLVHCEADGWNNSGCSCGEGLLLRSLVQRRTVARITDPRLCKWCFLRFADLEAGCSIVWVNCASLKVCFGEALRTRSIPFAAAWTNVIIGLADVIRGRRRGADSLRTCCRSAASPLRAQPVNSYFVMRALVAGK